ncbi:tripartite tricarboxylate transporter TctB family protein [Virgibacillus dakarensis]|uniref:tripartite tricarboxylate transporter TctB family protein n=1 Tax=Virgibacillus dakarensis TaxID=1917889 RepID=UPI000B42EC18|nr:tripartite tricarboxylate transporter TctB family protein [Virgibacillus dakarensis]MBT2217973.1 tripartite tricarboxylate transporter TctB family protein [Virgibacillus dakarensis]
MKSNIILGVITILFSVFFLIFTMQLPEARASSVVGPAGWPSVILTFMLIMGILQIVKTVREHKKAIGEPTKISTEEEKLPEVQCKDNEKIIGSHWYVLIAIAVYVLLLPIIGFLVVTPILFFFLAWLFGMRKKRHLISTTVASYVIFVLLFIYALGIPFPRGIGIFQTLSFWIY